jgi:YggT family protein
VGLLLASLVRIYTIIIVIRVVMSWFPPSGGAMSLVNDWLYRITEPVLGPVRRRLPPMGGIDLSPIVVLLFLQIIVVPFLIRL